MLIKCKECGLEISNKAAMCPKCGNPQTKQKVIVAKKYKGDKVIGICMIIGGAVMLMISPLMAAFLIVVGTVNLILLGGKQMLR